MSVLLETTGGGEGLATFRTGMTASTYMRCSDVPLQIAWICENFVTVFARKSSKLTMNHFMPQKVWSPCKPLIAMFAYILFCFIPMTINHVLVQTK